MSRGLGSRERALLERARRDGFTPVLADDIDVRSSEASSIRRAARSLQRKGLVTLSISPRNRGNGKSNRGCRFLNVLHMEPVGITKEQWANWTYRGEFISSEES